MQINVGFYDREMLRFRSHPQAMVAILEHSNYNFPVRRF
jgi:hypothetical protein